jgi:hypothetical protein
LLSAADAGRYEQARHNAKPGYQRRLLRFAIGEGQQGNLRALVSLR